MRHAPCIAELSRIGSRRRRFAPPRPPHSRPGCGPGGRPGAARRAGCPRATPIRSTRSVLKVGQDSYCRTLPMLRRCASCALGRIAGGLRSGRVSLAQGKDGSAAAISLTQTAQAVSNAEPAIDLLVIRTSLRLDRRLIFGVAVSNARLSDLAATSSRAVNMRATTTRVEPILSAIPVLNQRAS